MSPLPIFGLWLGIGGWIGTALALALLWMWFGRSKAVVLPVSRPEAGPSDTEAGSGRFRLARMVTSWAFVLIGILIAAFGFLILGNGYGYGFALVTGVAGLIAAIVTILVGGTLLALGVQGYSAAKQMH